MVNIVTSDAADNASIERRGSTGNRKRKSSEIKNTEEVAESAEATVDQHKTEKKELTR